MEPTRRTLLHRLRGGARRPATGPDHRATEAPPPAAGRDRRRRRGGQSLVEFAVVLPVFLLILAGILDFGLGLYSQMTVINAAREGARLGVVEPGNVADIKARVDAMAAGLDKSRLTISVTCQHSDGSACSGTWASTDTDSETVIVKVDYGYRMLWPLAFGNTLNLSSTVQMRIE
jgi:Flp pilus assembly protein TadG